MKLVVGLGNPGKQYEQTRHNAGFIVVDYLRKLFSFSGMESRFDGELYKGEIFSQPCMILKPLTYMNLSGTSVASCSRFYKIEAANITVIYDDVDLEPAKIKARVGGSSGGHNGIRSMIDELGSSDFHRIKIGIGKPFPGNVSPHVLGKFSKDELDHIEKVAINEVSARLKSIFLQTGSS